VGGRRKLLIRWDKAHIEASWSLERRFFVTSIRLGWPGLCLIISGSISRPLDHTSFSVIDGLTCLGALPWFLFDTLFLRASLASSGN
jgi:hypothetical protein